MALTLLSEAVCDRMKSDNASGAQTERRGDAGPVQGLLGGKDRTGRFYSRGQRSEVSFVGS
jgi:hypothetical protein